ncbi:unknown [Pseudomonas aeruginosa]|nr:unknown [Pseudomonas aeruginosa]
MCPSDTPQAAPAARPRNSAIGCARHFVCAGCGNTAKTTKARPSKVLCWRCRDKFARAAREQEAAEALAAQAPVKPANFS